MPLMGSGTPEIDYQNAPPLNGLEVWRRLAVPSVPRSAAKRFLLRDRVNNPKQCGSFGEVVTQLVDWKKLLAEYVLAGAQMPSDEDRRHSLLKMLPNLSMEMLQKAQEHATFAGLEGWVQDQDEFQKDLSLIHI